MARTVCMCVSDLTEGIYMDKLDRATTYMRVHYMVKDPLKVGVGPAIFPCIFIPPSNVEPLLLDTKIH